METLTPAMPRDIYLSGMQLERVREDWQNQNRESLEQMLESLGIHQVSDKINALLCAMRVRGEGSVFYESSEEKDRYEAVLGAFFTGAWK